MHKILITGSIHRIGLELLHREKDIEIQYLPELTYQEILKIIENFNCILTRSETAIPRELIDNAPNLKVIARAAVGIGNIDVDYATEKGILVINTPGINTTSAAELAIGESIQKGIAKEKYKPGNYEFLVALKETDPEMGNNINKLKNQILYNNKDNEI